MKFKSTRGGVSSLSFQDAVLSGLADDEGLLIPESIPVISAEQLQKWENFTFAELALEIMSLYVAEDEIPRTDLKSLIDKSVASFLHPEITPVVKLGDLFMLELFHGPTFSFKDVALQFLGNLFEYILQKRKSSITIVGATSGDTGSAAIHGLKGKKNIEIFILFPKGRVSKVQELQMISVMDPNVHSISLTDGTFDDCQSIVKTLFGDLEFKKEHRLGAINSINWSRIMSQTVYYFYAYFQVKKKLKKDTSIIFSVPTGNFGDIIAGYYAKKMGLPINHLIVATNSNDILDRFFAKGEYHKAAEVIPTCTPSMDIQVASNFERYLYYLSGEDSTRVREWMTDFARTGKLTVTGDTLAAAQRDFSSNSVRGQEVEATISRYYRAYKYIMDPHTAVAVAAAEAHFTNQHCVHSHTPTAMVCLSTAHPAKFGDVVNRCLAEGMDVVTDFELTRKLVAETKDTRCTEVKSSLDEVKNLIQKTLSQK